MTGREKIIIFFALGVLIFGAYNFLYSTSENVSGNSEKNLSELNNLVNGMAEKINKYNKSNISYILEKAVSKWKKDPFVHYKSALDVVGKEENIKAKSIGPSSISCSGFIEAGGKMLAVINGVEYEEGDSLGRGGYSVIKISRESVVLRTGEGEEIIVLIDKY